MLEIPKNTKIAWSPQPKQEIALARIEDEILMGGARGGGKTEGLLAWFLYDIKYPFYRALVIRKNADDLKDWIDRARMMYKLVGAEIVGNPPEVRFPKGGKIRTGHLNDENAYMKYQGSEYQKIGIEELSQIPREKDYLRLIGSCRSSYKEIQPQVFATTNPDEPGIEWIKARWGIPDIPDFEKIYQKFTAEGKSLVFIPAKLEDNPLLMNSDPNYLKYLESLKAIDYELWSAWRLGNWKGYGIEGSYYRQQLEKCEQENRITDIPYEDLLPVYTWCDLGIGDTFCIGYFQINGMEWRVIDYDEFNGESLGMAIERMKEKNYRYAEHYAPHDIQVKELGTGKTRWEIALQNGVSYRIVPKLEIEDGINALRMKFTSLWFDKTKCDLLLKRLRRYHKEFDNKRGVFKNTPVHDINSHACFTGDILVETENGKKPIKDIKIGDILKTPFGKTKVLIQKNMGKKKVYDFMGIYTTSNHPFLTVKGFRPLDALRYYDKMYVWKKKQLFTITYGSIAIPAQLKERAVFIFLAIKRIAEKKLDYIAMFGKKKTVLFLMNTIFTIKTVIHLIMDWIILNLSAQDYIINTTMLENGGNIPLKSLEFMQVNGINQKKERSGTQKWLNNAGKQEKGLKKFVRCAGKNTKRPSQTGQNSAGIIANLPFCGEKEVFNLTTSNGIFVANDMIVSNSDMMRYWAVSEKQIVNYQPIKKFKYNDDDFFTNQEDKVFDPKNMFPEI